MNPSNIKFNLNFIKSSTSRRKINQLFSKYSRIRIGSVEIQIEIEKVGVLHAEMREYASTTVLSKSSSPERNIKHPCFISCIHRPLYNWSAGAHYPKVKNVSPKLF